MAGGNGYVRLGAVAVTTDYARPSLCGFWPPACRRPGFVIRRRQLCGARVGPAGDDQHVGLDVAVRGPNGTHPDSRAHPEFWLDRRRAVGDNRRRTVGISEEDVMRLSLAPM